MSSSFEEIGIKMFTDDELEEIADSLELKIDSYLHEHKFWKLLTDFGIIVSLIQSSDKILTLTLDFDMAGGLSSSQLDALQEEIYEYAQKLLKEELLCRKNS